MSRTLLIALGGLVAVVLLGLFVVMPLLTPGPEEAAETPVAETDDGAEPAPDDGQESDPEPEPDPVDETFEVFTARDPFQQLVSTSSSAVTAGDGGDGGDTGDTSDDTGDDTGDDDGGDAPTSGTSVSGTVVELVEVFTDSDGTPTVQVTVNGTGYDVVEGDDFGQRFRLLDISGQCATFLFGDQRFTLCEGETIRK